MEWGQLSPFAATSGCANALGPLACPLWGHLGLYTVLPGIHIGSSLNHKSGVGVFSFISLCIVWAKRPRREACSGHDSAGGAGLVSADRLTISSPFARAIRPVRASCSVPYGLLSHERRRACAHGRKRGSTTPFRGLSAAHIALNLLYGLVPVALAGRSQCLSPRGECKRVGAGLTDAQAREVRLAPSEISAIQVCRADAQLDKTRNERRAPWTMHARPATPPRERPVR